MTPSVFAFLQELAKSPIEQCGVIIDDVPVVCDNIDQKPESNFFLDPKHYVALSDWFKVQAIFHTHPDSCRPTAFDIEQCNLGNVPWFIIGPDGLWRIDPLHTKKGLLRRTFNFGWDDCFSLIRNYYCDSFQDIPRAIETTNYMYLDHYQEFGFKEVDDLAQGDVIVFSGKHEKYSHAGIYLGDGYFIHHPLNAQSRRDIYDAFYQKKTTLILRRDTKDGDYSAVWCAC